MPASASHGMRRREKGGGAVMAEIIARHPPHAVRIRHIERIVVKFYAVGKIKITVTSPYDGVTIRRFLQADNFIIIRKGHIDKAARIFGHFARTAQIPRKDADPPAIRHKRSPIRWRRDDARTVGRGILLVRLRQRLKDDTKTATRRLKARQTMRR